MIEENLALRRPYGDVNLAAKLSLRAASLI
jgi:hypothetical protein